MDTAPTTRPLEPHEADESGTYEICVQGRLDARWAAGLAGLTLHTTPDGFTLLEGVVVDQTALHGVLQRLRDLGLPLHSVTRVAAPRHDPRPTTTTPLPRHDTSSTGA